MNLHFHFDFEMTLTYLKQIANPNIKSESYFDHDNGMTLKKIDHDQNGAAMFIYVTQIR
jgi:hypothetical protein